MHVSDLRQVGTYSVSPQLSGLKIFQEEDCPSYVISEPLLIWDRDEEGRPRIIAEARGGSGGGATFEFNLLISTPASIKAAQRAVMEDFSEQNHLRVVTHVDCVSIGVQGELGGDLLTFEGGEIYPTRTEHGNVISLVFVGKNLSTTAEDIDRVRAFLRTIRLKAKAVINGHELPWVSLNFRPLPVNPPALPAEEEGGGEGYPRQFQQQLERLGAPYNPTTINVTHANIYRLAWTPSGNLVVTTNTAEVNILRRDGTLVRKLGGPGAGAGEFQNSAGLAVSRQGLIFIGDTGTHRISVFKESGEFVRTFGGGAAGNVGQFNLPTAIAISRRTGRVFIADHNNHRVVVCNQFGACLHRFGGLGADVGQLNKPHGIDVDDQDNIYVSENGNNRVSVFTAEGKFLRLFGCTGALAGQFNGANNLCVDRENERVIMADCGNKRIQIFTLDGKFEHFVVPGNQDCCAVAVDNEGRITVGGWTTKNISFYEK